MTPIRVGIWGVYGRGNYGNEAALAAFLDQLPRGCFAPVLITEAPDIASALHGVPARRIVRPVGPVRGGRVVSGLLTASNRMRYLVNAFRAAGTLDTIVIAGSGGLERYGSGAFGTPFEVWSLAVAARLRRRPFVLLDIGVEYLPRRLARFFVRGAARRSVYRSYRDESSRESMAANGVRGTADDLVVTDMVFALKPTMAPERSRGTVVVGVMDYWGRDREHDALAVHDAYVARCRSLVALLIAGGHDVRVVGGDDEDLVFARDLIDAPGLEDVPVIHAASPSELTREMSAAAAVVATRYHTLIMSLLALTPAVSIGYGRKHQAMLAQLELPDTHRDIEDFSPAEVADLVDAAIRDAPTLRASIGTGVERAAARLEAQWPDLLSILSSRRKEAA